MVVRSAMHQAGATALTQLLEFAAPATGQRSIPCSCGHSAPYRELRSKPVLSVVGQIEVLRPYYLCPHCHAGQFPADVELAVPILYVQMDGTGVPVVKKETVGRKGKTDGQPAHTREGKLGCVFTQTT